VSANQYDLDYFRHVLQKVEGWQLDGSDILAMIDLVRNAVADHGVTGGRPPLALAAPIA
jgi:TPP-dependent pyruvate/acetoin dehydrogenase alpha subunit